MPGHVEPRLAVEADRIDHELLAFPVADGITVPGGIDVLGMRASIERNLAIAVDIAFEQDDEQIGRLHHLGWIRIAARHAGWQAARLGIVFAEVGLAFLEKRSE